MTKEPRSGCRPGDRLPDLALPATTGGAIQLRSPAEGPLVLVLVRFADAAACREYLDTLAGASADFAVWDGRLLAVFDSPPGRGTRTEEEVEAGAPTFPFAAAVDEEHRLRRSCGLRPAETAVIIADRWGEIYFVATDEGESALPNAATIEEWLRYLATQCPECGVPDESVGGEWAA
jgi:peroxiredoxin